MGLSRPDRSANCPQIGRTLPVSITFKLEYEGHSEEVNFSNGNAAAILTLAGLPSAPYGEIPHERLESVIRKMIRVVNCESSGAQTLISVADGLRWSEGARTDESLKRRVAEMMALLVFARTSGCGVAWG